VSSDVAPKQARRFHLCKEDFDTQLRAKRDLRPDSAIKNVAPPSD
jgi:hypothetical protein